MKKSIVNDEVDISSVSDEVASVDAMTRDSDVQVATDAYTTSEAARDVAAMRVRLMNAGYGAEAACMDAALARLREHLDKQGDGLWLLVMADSVSLVRMFTHSVDEREGTLTCEIGDHEIDESGMEYFVDSEGVAVCWEELHGEENFKGLLRYDPEVAPFYHRTGLVKQLEEWGMQDHYAELVGLGD